jgi:hypothetical protein
LEVSLSYLRNDDLLMILENEQLPKLKNIFELPTSITTMRKKSNASGQIISAQSASQNAQSNQSLAHIQNQNSTGIILELTPRVSSKQSG